MKQTFLTTMKSEAGAFLRATKIIAGCGGNITRVNYNKSVDEHTLFIDVEAEESKLKEISAKLNADGFLTDALQHANVVLLEFKLKDECGALLPVLEIIESYNINITYINSEENKTAYQYFKMGLYIENPKKVKELLEAVSKYCETKIIEYDPTEKILDNTVFYLSFASDIGDRLKLSADEKRELILESNKVMQNLDDRGESPYKSFEYIGRFAELISGSKGANFKPRITQRILGGGAVLYLIEPPCGSNTYIIEVNGKLLFVDCGFACFEKEMKKIFNALFPDFDQAEKQLILTHPDTDHYGLINMFDKVWLSSDAADDLNNLKNGLPVFRELIPAHAPYSAISNILTNKVKPVTENFCIINKNNPHPKPMEKIGRLDFEGIRFEFYAGSGGHTKGEILCFCEKFDLIFTGDVYVNFKAYTPEQNEFNKIAPYLMTNVDTDSALASAFRKEFFNYIKGKTYTLCTGHGALYEFPDPERE